MGGGGEMYKNIMFYLIESKLLLLLAVEASWCLHLTSVKYIGVFFPPAAFGNMLAQIDILQMRAGWATTRRAL